MQKKAGVDESIRNPGWRGAEGILDGMGKRGCGAGREMIELLRKGICCLIESWKLTFLCSLLFPSFFPQQSPQSPRYRHSRRELYSCYGTAVGSYIPLPGRGTPPVLEGASRYLLVLAVLKNRM